MNKKGFISISVIYSFFIVFLMLLLFIVDGYVNNRSLIKRISAKVIEEATNVSYCEANVHSKICEILPTYDISQNEVNFGGGKIYHHDENLENGANDNSFRFAGVNPNNYICFGSNASTCPNGNLYRIIGIMPVDVVVDDSNPGNLVTEREELFKIIKNDYVTFTELGVTSSPGNAAKISSYNGPSGNQPSGNIDGFHWNDLNDNTWSGSTLNSVLNTTYLTNLNDPWSNKIANVIWKVGGNAWDALLDGNEPGANPLQNLVPINLTYTNEIIYSGIMQPNHIGTWVDPTDNLNELNNKVGLMYVSDYGFAAEKSAWTSQLNRTDNNDYQMHASINWMYRGVFEWTITRRSDSTINYPTNVFRINSNGNVGSSDVNFQTWGVRPTFYLNEDIKIISGNGTKSNPFRVS